jgi:hypothetical protein
MLDAREDGLFISERIAWLHPQHESSTALRAWMLRQQKDAGLCSLRSGSVSKPRSQRYAGCVIGRNAAEVQNDCAETTSL